MLFQTRYMMVNLLYGSDLFRLNQTKLGCSLSSFCVNICSSNYFV